MNKISKVATNNKIFIWNPIVTVSIKVFHATTLAKTSNIQANYFKVGRE